MKILESGKQFNEAEQQQLPKLGWLKSYQGKFQEWDEVKQVANLTEQSVRQEGVILAMAIKHWRDNSRNSGQS